MAQHKTIPVEKICPVCTKPFPVCPEGKASRYYPPYETEFCSPEHARQGRYRHGRVCRSLANDEATYLAGFMDGEGSIILHRRSDTKNVSLRVSIANTFLPIIETIREMTQLGTVITTIRENQKHKTAYHWNTNSDAAVSFLEQIAPYLRVKKAQAELAIQFQSGMRDPSTKTNRDWQTDCLTKMKSLNAEGPI